MIESKIYVLIERDYKYSITGVYTFANELAVWTAYETSEACYATVHLTTLDNGIAGVRLSSERSESLFADFGSPESERALGHE